MLSSSHTCSFQISWQNNHLCPKLHRECIDLESDCTGLNLASTSQFRSVFMKVIYAILLLNVLSMAWGNKQSWKRYIIIPCNIQNVSEGGHWEGKLFYSYYTHRHTFSQPLLISWECEVLACLCIQSWCKKGRFIWSLSITRQYLFVFPLAAYQ